MTTPGSHAPATIDRLRRRLTLGAAGAPLAAIAGCGGGSAADPVPSLGDRGNISGIGGMTRRVGGLPPLVAAAGSAASCWTPA